MIRASDDLDACEEAYLGGLARCFPGWGGTAAYAWCFRRDAGAGPADLLLADEAGQLIAGSALTYRLARLAGGAAVERIACMTGSWTLPEARGRGVFRDIIATSREQAASRGCRLLLAFAAAANPSARALAAAGAQPVPAAYLRRAGPKRAASKVPIEEALEAFARRSPRPNASRMVYPEGAWRGQLVDRPNPVHAISPAPGRYALVESTPEGERLLDISAADAGAFAEAAACVDLAWSLHPADVEAGSAAGFSPRPGALFLLDCGEPAPAGGGRWSIANGERM